VYATRPDSGEHFLVGFARTEVAPGERVALMISVPLDRLATWRGPGHWEVDPGAYRIEVGASSDDPAAVSTTIDLARVALT
jgi:hypothetical protein